MIILVINCGSSSIKYQLLDMKSDDVYDIIAKGIAEKIGLPAGILQYAPTGGEKIVTDVPIPDHKVGMQLILAALTDKKTGVLKSLEDIEALGHRIVPSGHPCHAGGPSQRAAGGYLRHRFPPDHACLCLYVRPSLRIL